MATISIRINDEDKKIINDYVKFNNLNLSDFIRETILEKIEDDMEMSEDFTRKLIESRREAKKGELYSIDEVFKELGL